MEFCCSVYTDYLIFHLASYKVKPLLFAICISETFLQTAFWAFFSSVSIAVSNHSTSNLSSFGVDRLCSQFERDATNLHDLRLSVRLRATIIPAGLGLLHGEASIQPPSAPAPLVPLSRQPCQLSRGCRLLRPVTRAAKGCNLRMFDTRCAPQVYLTGATQSRRTGWLFNCQGLCDFEAWGRSHRVQDFLGHYFRDRCTTPHVFRAAQDVKCRSTR